MAFFFFGFCISLHYIHGFPVPWYFLALVKNRVSQSFILSNQYGILRVLLFQFSAIVKRWILRRLRRRLTLLLRRPLTAQYQLMRWLGEHLPYPMVVSMEVFWVLPSSILPRYGLLRLLFCCLLQSLCCIQQTLGL